ncbi:hypothetical protein ACHHYP_07999 [Achlya hypogyna]|uniref:Secreted protein n=1 Tax=Achlya hypogyna TaxID=1202772 RepID=A0A0A7CNY2_ACHHY|nr:secreted protein [Achlya hypogyna]OQR87851.1 hypothetical protein ACHHYP_07999 [Achlya hypogyna]
MYSIASLIASVLLGAALIEANGPVGGWSNASVTEVQALYEAAAVLPTSYPSASCPRVCATSFTSAQKQVVAGVQYKLLVQGCEVKTESATVAGCTCSGSPSGYAISLFTPAAETATLITRVVAASGTPEADPTGLVGAFSTPSAPTADDKALFANATSAEANYESASVARVCPTDFLTVSKQVVAGQKLIYSLKGCSVPTASPAALANCGTTCTAANTGSYQIEIFAGLDGSFKVSSSLQSKADGTFVTVAAGNSTTGSTVGSKAGSSAGKATTTAPTTAAPKAASSATTASVAIASLAVAAAACMN